MALHANAFGSCAQLRVGWKDDPMIAMANDAPRKPGGLKRTLMRTLIVHLCLKHMAVGAHIPHRIDSRGNCSVISMAGGACRSAHIAANRHRLVVHACVVLRK